MTPAAENLRVLIEARDLDGFLETFEAYRQTHAVEPVVTALTQRLFLPLLRKAFLDEPLKPSSPVRLYRMARDTRLLSVENDLIVGVNLRINEVLRQVERAAKVPVLPLIAVEDVKPAKEIRWSQATSAGHPVRATEVKRVAVVSSFSISARSAVDAYDFRKNACTSQQEREFLRAVRQFFPSLQAYPNVPLKNVIDIDKLEAALPVRARSYAWLAQVDVLLCTADEDPVAGIEVDSMHHDSEEATERDELKNLLFKLAGLPLVRFRADEEKAVRAEDFYDLLIAESETLNSLRPRRLRPRRTHDFLVPAESATRSADMAHCRAERF